MFIFQKLKPRRSDKPPKFIIHVRFEEQAGPFCSPKEIFTFYPQENKHHSGNP